MNFTILQAALIAAAILAVGLGVGLYGGFKLGSHFITRKAMWARIQFKFYEIRDFFG